MLAINSVDFKYKTEYIIKEISFQINQGEIVTMVGKNGAGKTTIIKLIMGFLNPSNGEIKINQLNPFKNQKQILGEVGYVAGELTIMEDETAAKLFNIKLDILKIGNREYLDYLIKLFELDVSKKVKKLSKGNKQKVALILALMSKPKFLILDEPTSGLDPAMQRLFWTEVDKLNHEQQTSIFLCTHIYQEVKADSKKILYLKEGKIIQTLEGENISNSAILNIFEGMN